MAGDAAEESQAAEAEAPAAEGVEEAAGEAAEDPQPAKEAEEEEPAAEADGEKCPECKQPMEPGSVLCIKCGFHTKLRKKIKTSFG